MWRRIDIDLTLSDEDDAADQNACGGVTPSTEHKSPVTRRLSHLPLADIDHHQLQLGIEDEVLNRPSGSSSVLNLYPHQAENFTQTTRRAHASSTRELKPQEKACDMEMLDAETFDFTPRSAKKRRLMPPAAMPLIYASSSQSDYRQSLHQLNDNNQGFKLTDEDYLGDEDLEFILKTGARVGEDSKETELLPDTIQEIIDLEEDDAAEVAIEGRYEDEEQEEWDSPRASGIKRRKSPISDSQLNNIILEEEVTSITHRDNKYQAGSDVEFHDGKFMRVKSIHKSNRGSVVLSGFILTRHKQQVLNPKDQCHTPLITASLKQNEVILTPTERNVHLDEVLRPRKIIFTNQTWPCVSSQTINDGLKRGSMELYTTGALICRMKRIEKPKTKSQQYEDGLVRLTEVEADPGYKIKASKLRFAWRRQHVPPGGGSAKSTRNVVAQDGSLHIEDFHQYTFADCFCGAGGASQGAKLAGLSIKWAIDFDEKAIRSYKANFGSATTYHKDISDHIHDLNDAAAADLHRVDILHLSPPCQAFSLARTHGSDKAREHLEAMITSVGPMVERVKPRIVTMEETAGLYQAHKEWLAVVARQLVDHGYSISWKILKGQFYGVPQIRQRLIIVAAGPGETLPPWPEPTFGPGTSRGLPTIHDAINNIPPLATHNQVISKMKKPGIPFSPRTLAKTLTCGGGENYHPSGLRPYTVREAACLQTFPFFHSFANANLTAARKQIGNAFPPMLARAVYRSCIQSLKKTDGVQ